MSVAIAPKKPAAKHKPVPAKDAERGDPSIGLVTEDGGIYISPEHLKRVDDDPERARRQIRRMLMDLKEPKIIRGPTKRPPDVRLAGPKDELAIYNLVIMDLEENARVAPIAKDEVEELIMRGTRQKGGIVSVIDDKETGLPIAVQIIVHDKWWWSKSRHLIKVMDFVHPEHRSSNYGAQLIEFSKWITDRWTENFGYQVYLLSGVLGTKRTKDKVRLYGRHVTPVGAYYLYPFPDPWD